jgi:hypothetical protein
MRARPSFTLVLLLAAACGGESQSSRRDGNGNGGTPVAGSSGAGATAGAGLGGSAGVLGVTGGNGGDCPEDEPTLGSSCSTTFNCSYPACDSPTGSGWSCRDGRWLHLWVPGCSLEGCPEDFPEALSLCNVPYDKVCSYERPCCDVLVVSTARCANGLWEVDDEHDLEGRNVCPYCTTARTGTDTCSLPDGCSSLSCHERSCYARPEVSRCVDGVWSSVSLCSK